MRAVTGKPFKLLGVGEKWDALEDFHPSRVASRILGMGDVVSLVEKAAQTIDVEKAQKIAQKMKQGAFDLDDMAEQLNQMQKIGGMSGVLGMMPGMGKIKQQIAGANLDDSILKHQHAIITSMTPKERRNPKVLDARRKRRIAAGSGTDVQDVNKLIKMHRQMADMMKSLGRNKGMLNRLMGGGGPSAPSEAEMAAMQEELGKLDPKALEQLPKDLKDALPKGLPGLAGGMPTLPRGLPGLGAGLPGLGGGLPKFPGVPGKKK
jgi:signal recognition particle subunit SRP54